MSELAQRGPAWLVLPTYNEAENIEAFVDAVLAKLPASARVLIVEDNSPDGTGRIADRLAAANEGVEVLHRECRSDVADVGAVGLLDHRPSDAVGEALRFPGAGRCRAG